MIRQLRPGLAALLLLVAGCAPKGLTEGYAEFIPAQLPVEKLDACSLSRPQVRIPAEFYLVVDPAPYTASRIALARGGGVSELNIGQEAVKALDTEGLALANLAVAPLTDLFDVVVPVTAGYAPEPDQLFGRLSFEAVPFGLRQLPVMSASDVPLALQYRFVQITVRLRVEKDGKPVDDFSATGYSYAEAAREDLRSAVKSSGRLNAEALCGALRQLGVKFRRSGLFGHLGGPLLGPTAPASPASGSARP